MPDPVPVLVMTTDVCGEVDSEFFTVEATEGSVRFLRCDGSDLVFDRQELLAALELVEAERRAA